MGDEPHAQARPPPLSSAGARPSLATAQADDDAPALEPAVPPRTRRQARSSVRRFFVICSWLHLEWKGLNKTSARARARAARRAGQQCSPRPLQILYAPSQTQASGSFSHLSFTTETRVVRKNRSAGVSPASEPRQLLLGQHDLCRLEAGDTFFLTTTEPLRKTRHEFHELYENTFSTPLSS